MNRLHPNEASYDIGGEKLPDIDAIVWTAARHTAREAFARYCANLSTKLYLYHRPSRHGFARRTCLAPSVPGHGWELSTVEHLPRHYTADKLTYWVHGILRNLPVFGY